MTREDTADAGERDGEAYQTAPLRVEAETPDEQPVPLDGTLPVRVCLVNEGADTQVVNRRLEPGYRDSLAREVFVDVADAESGRPVSVDRVDYDRSFAGPDEYVRLPPGEGLSATFDLLEWYPLREPGRYRLTVFYQADEELATTPDDVVRGTYASHPVEVTVGPPANT